MRKSVIVFSVCSLSFFVLLSDCTLFSYHHGTTNILWPFFRTSRLSRCQKRTCGLCEGKIKRGRHTDHLAGRDSIWTNKCPPPPSPHFLQTGCPSCRPTNSVRALKATQSTVLIRVHTLTELVAGLVIDWFIISLTRPLTETVVAWCVSVTSATSSSTTTSCASVPKSILKKAAVSCSASRGQCAGQAVSSPAVTAAQLTRGSVSSVSLVDSLELTKSHLHQVTPPAKPASNGQVGNLLLLLRS